MTGILMAVLGAAGGAIAPVNTVAPAVTGTATVGQTLSCSTGTWTGTPTPSYTYQWQYGAGNTNISGATSSTYVITSAYVGETIRCLVTATNAAGAVSAPSNSTSAVSATVPTAPTIGTVSYNTTTSLIVGYSAPSSNGGATITSYTAVSTPGGLTGSVSRSGSGTITVNGLTKGTSYTFVVYATNSAGNSPTSASSAAKIASTAPVAPTIGTATATGTTTATVAFTPGDDGGQAVTSYRATSTPGGITVTGASSPISVTGLTSGTSYTFTVSALNPVGRSSESAASNAVTPFVGGYIAYSPATTAYPYPGMSGVTASGELYDIAGWNGTTYPALKFNSSGTLTIQKGSSAAGQSDSTTGLNFSGSSPVSCPGNDTAFYVFSADLTSYVKYRNSYIVLGAGIYGTDVIYGVRYQNSPGISRICRFTTDSPPVQKWMVDYSGFALGTTGGCYVNTTTGHSLVFQSPYIILLNASGAEVYAKQSAAFGSFDGASVNDSNVATFVGANGLYLISSTGTLLWGKSTSGGTPYRLGTVDSATTDVYMASLDNGSGPYGVVIYRFNSSGTLIWQRRFYATNTDTLWCSSLNVVGSYMYLSIGVQTASYAFAGNMYIKLPIDGSGMQTFTFNGKSYTYTTGSITVNSASPVINSYTSSRGGGTTGLYKDSPVNTTTLALTYTTVAI